MLPHWFVRMTIRVGLGSPYEHSKMRLHVNCVVFLSLVTSYSCNSSILMKWEGYNESNSNTVDCLENLMKTTTWITSDFLLISEDMSAGPDQLVSRYPNFRWELNSGTPNNLTGLVNVIIFTKSFDDLEKILRVVDIKEVDDRAKYVIGIGNNFADSEDIKFASKVIPKIMWKLDKMYVVFLVPCGENILAMTYFPFSDHCQPGELEILDVWRKNRFENNVVLFPEKAMDAKGCRQHHTIIPIEEFALLYQTEFSESGKQIPGGVGGRLSTIIAEKMNIDFCESNEKEWSEIEILNEIIRGEVDIIFGGVVPITIMLKTMTMEAGYMEQSFGFGYIANEAVIPLTNLARPLSFKLWALTAVTFLILGAFIFLTTWHRWQNEVLDGHGGLDVFGVFVGNTRPMPRYMFGRYVFGIWILFSFWITAAYTCGLISFLTTQNGNRVINTFEELLDSGLEFGGGEFHHQFYNDPSDPSMMKIYNNFQIWGYDKSLSKIFDEQQVSGVTTSSLFFFNFLRQDLSGNRLHMMEDKTFSYLAPIALRRGLPLAIGIRRYAARVIQGGFNTYWLNYYQRNLTKPEQKGPSPLALKHVHGIFLFHLIGLIFSSVVFMLELISPKYWKSFSQCANSLTRKWRGRYILNE